MEGRGWEGGGEGERRGEERGSGGKAREVCMNEVR